MPAVVRAITKTVPAKAQGERDGKDGEWPVGDGTRFAIAILIFFLAMFAMFIAFHPTGPNPAEHPDDVLKWLLGEYEGAVSGKGVTGTAPAVQPNPDNQPGNNPNPGTAPGNAIGQVANDVNNALNPTPGGALSGVAGNVGGAIGGTF